jgi:hypothetical protein
VTKEQNPDSNFGQRLRAELKAVVAERGAAQAASEAKSAEAATPAWRRGPRLALGGGVALAAVAAGLIVSAGGDNTSKAFAVEPQDGGGVTIKIYSPEDAAGLEGALGEAGIRSQVTWLPAGMTCREPRFTPSTVETSMGGTIGGVRVGGPAPAMTIGVMSPEQYRERWREYERGEISEGEYHESTPNFSLDPASFRPDQTVVISGSRGPYGGDPEGGYEAQFAIAEGPVEPCEPVRVPDGGSLAETNRILESESVPSSAAK